MNRNRCCKILSANANSFHQLVKLQIETFGCLLSVLRMTMHVPDRPPHALTHRLQFPLKIKTDKDALS